MPQITQKNNYLLKQNKLEMKMHAWKSTLKQSHFSWRKMQPEKY